MRKNVILAWTAALALLTAPAAQAHVLNITRTNFQFDASNRFRLSVAVDLTTIIGTSEEYYQLSIMPPEQQAARMREIAPRVLDQFVLMFGKERVKPTLITWKVPVASHETYLDYYVGKMTELTLEGNIPPGRPPLTFSTDGPGGIEYPLAYTMERPDRNHIITRFLEINGEVGETFNYDAGAPAAAATVAQSAVSPEKVSTQSGVSGGDLTPGQRMWRVQTATLWRFLKLGFHHIVPEGTDHILFVLGLFFLGISWRKLLSQTTVFTIAHATTLYLSSKGIFSLPSWFVEPAIALSIAFIAVENIFKPKLSAGRLVIVFMFGLIHGLGFAAGLKELSLPPREFMTGLLGFNFGVDFGQLFIIGIAFVLVGWFRRRPWYFSRVAIPASALIALTGLFWAVERIVFYARLA